VTGCCESRNKLSRLLRREEFRDKLIDHQLLKTDSAVRSFISSLTRSLIAPSTAPPRVLVCLAACGWISGIACNLHLHVAVIKHHPDV
jgi:hypothetical protein